MQIFPVDRYRGIAYFRPMMILRRVSPLILLVLFFMACREKKKPVLAGEEPMEVSDFIASFPKIALPFQYVDSSLSKIRKDNDSLFINPKIFAQFVPDSVLQAIFGKHGKPKIHPIGKIEAKQAETYLFIRTVLAEKKAVILLVFDKKQHYANYMNLLSLDNNSSTTQSFLMDRRGTITQTITRRNADGSSSEGKDVYSYIGDENQFSLIMTDPLNDTPAELINPIDTLTKKFKYAGDYISGKMNLVSIRDSRRANRISFFIHFEKTKECTGELKGEAIMRTATTAEYNRDGDPCKLKFIFSSGYITLKEEEGCGSYRPLNCSFDLKFPKKKEIRPKKTGKKK